MSGFDTGYNAAANAFGESQRIKEQQRVQQQNTVGMQLLNAANNASNVKQPTDPQTIIDETGKEVPNPVYLSKKKAYDDAQDATNKLISQYSALNSPEQHASFAQHLHGLIFGKPTEHAQQPILSPNSKPVAPMADPNAPAPPPAPPDATAPGGGVSHPLASAPADHPLHAITNGIKTLGNHLKAAANPLPPNPNPVDPAMIAKYYRDPGAVAAERAQELQETKGANALAVAQERTRAITASLAARPPRFLAQSTIPDLIAQAKVDPELIIYGPDGRELSLERLAEMPKGTVAREFQAGSRTFYALGDQNSKTLNVNGQIYNIPAVGPVNIAGPDANSTVIGQATSTLPHTDTKVTEDPFGLKTKSAGTRQTIVPQLGPPAFNPPAGATPTLLRRPDGLANPVPPTIVPVNPGARTPGTIPSGGAVKSKPVSSAAPSVPSSQPVALDENGHIPPGVGNDLIRQAANGILDGRDPKEFGNPKAQLAALALVDKVVPGYSRGAFTPREKIQFQTAITFLNQLKDSNSLNVLDSYWGREKLAQVMKDPNKSTMLSRLAAAAETKPEQELVRNIQAAAGVVQALSGITRSGKPTNAGVATLKTELPNVFQSPSSDDARKRIDNLLKEADIALHTNPRDVGKKGPVSANAPTTPPKVGDTKTFPNGKVGKWDGTGYVAQ